MNDISGSGAGSEPTDRRKKIINAHERETRKLLSNAAEKNGAQVFTKIRIADVLDINGSGLDNDHFGFALKGHFDFVVANGDDLPLFAVEFDGPYHLQNKPSQENDRRKNLICERLAFPLARVRDEHIFRKARGIDYLTWLTELFFSFQALVEAQKQGQIPWDEPLDPMMFVTHPNIAGRFPLFISAKARIRLQQLHEAGVLGSSAPFYFSGDDSNNCTACLAVVPATPRAYLFTSASIYLRGFGVSPSEAAEEIATVNLAQLAEEYRQTRNRSVSSKDVRARLVDFLRQHSRGRSFGGISFDMGFSVSYKQEGGTAYWFIGPLGQDAAVRIEQH